jgi:hypothetical protein
VLQIGPDLLASQRLDLEADRDPAEECAPALQAQGVEQVGVADKDQAEGRLIW